MSCHGRGAARAQLKIDEGVARWPYKDTVGKVTIGVGRNLTDKGLRSDEIELLLEHDLDDAEADARALFPGFDQLSELRQAALVNMAFNLGRDRLAGFAQVRAAVEAGDFNRAAAEMLDSKWARQVGARAQRLARAMREG